MIVKFKDKHLEDLYSIPVEKLGKQAISREIIRHYKKKIDLIMRADDLSEVRQYKGLHLEKLKEDRYKDCFSIKANDQYRIIFTEGPDGEISVMILELSKHYK